MLHKELACLDCHRLSPASAGVADLRCSLSVMLSDLALNIISSLTARVYMDNFSVSFSRSSE